eukprot:m51a1_g7732 hypothetical protein (627) ;mRNA; f:167059-169169
MEPPSEEVKQKVGQWFMRVARVASNKPALVVLQPFVLANAHLFEELCSLCSSDADITSALADQLTATATERERERKQEERERREREERERREREERERREQEERERESRKKEARERVWEVYRRTAEREKKRYRMETASEMERRLNAAALDDDALLKLCDARTLGGVAGVLGMEEAPMPGAPSALSPAAVLKAYSKAAEEAPSRIAEHPSLLAKTQRKETTMLFCHRPASETAGSIPVVLLSQELRAFTEMCRNALPDKEDCAVTVDLARKMPNVDLNEADRTTQFFEVFQKLVTARGLNNFGPLTIGSMTTDGSIRCLVPEVLLSNLEVKADTGVGGELDMQNFFYYAHFWAQEGVASVVLRSPCPAVLLGLEGPLLRVYVAAGRRVDPVVVLNLLLILDDMDAMVAVARFVHAFKETLPRLLEHYREVLSSLNVSLPLEHYFPDFVRFSPREGEVVQLRYTDWPVKQRLLFRAEVVSTTGEREIPKRLAVKFVKRYCLLLYEGPLGEPDGWRVVVMEWMEGLLEFHQALKGGGQHFKDSLVQAVQLLHKNGYVHGDLRIPNVLGSRNSEGMVDAIVVDFDWAGRDGTALYPPFMNHERVVWADGVSDSQPMKCEHDEVMVRRLLP